MSSAMRERMPCRQLFLGVLTPREHGNGIDKVVVVSNVSLRHADLIHSQLNSVSVARSVSARI